jgi:hypothetical protein
MKISTYIIATFFILLSAQAKAQQAQATAGPYGVFIQFEKLLHGPQYVIERLLIGTNNAGTPDWKPVCTTENPPRSAADLIARLTILSRKNPLYEIPNDSLTTLLFETIVYCHPWIHWGLTALIHNIWKPSALDIWIPTSNKESVTTIASVN